MQCCWLVLTACFLAQAAGKLVVLNPEVLRANLLLSKTSESVPGGDMPLLLTPYLEAGRASKARLKARVRGPPFRDDGIVSYSGFFTVDKRFNSNIFFWFFPAEEPSYGNNAPMLVWLQGGPGSSSMFGLFTELGPYRVGANDTLEVSPHSWHTNYSVLFFDNPVGTGMSFTDSEGYCRNQSQVSDNLYSALKQFYSMFPEMLERDLYLTGESYAGKYVPSFAYAIHKNNPTAKTKINLKGLLIGNGYSDPISTMQYSDYVYQLGLVDTQCRDRMKEHEQAGIACFHNGQNDEALMHRHRSMWLFMQCSEYSNVYNYLHPTEPKEDGDYASFLRREDVRRALHVGGVLYEELSYSVYYNMQSDMMVSVRPLVEELLDSGYYIVYYSGQMDIIVAYPLSVEYYNSLEFSSAEEYHNADRKPWYVDGELAGYSKTAGNFTEVMVRNAGHMVPSDQPHWALDIVRRVTSATGF